MYIYPCISTHHIRITIPPKVPSTPLRLDLSVSIIRETQNCRDKKTLIYFSPFLVLSQGYHTPRVVNPRCVVNSLQYSMWSVRVVPCDIPDLSGKLGKQSLRFPETIFMG